ncbi:MAG: glycoside hydrolase family 99-like domain-containing protein [Lentisphaerae bacterium]|nr:glycoside hydrolase family 99-like domain-containing protein [Lentisphaerota bacterium]
MTRFSKWLIGMALLCLVVACRREGTDGSEALASARYLVGAHYYVWFPSNFGSGMLRTRLVPPQEPMAGFYSSDTPAAAEEHIAWCSQYGVDFLTLDWWPGRPEQNEAISTGFLKARNIADIQFCIFYESWALGFNPDYGCTEFTPERRAQFVSDLLGLTEQFFDHPSYLRVQGRPVVLLYLTRTFTGDFAGAIADYRAAARARGHDPYLIGDEIFWKVSPLVAEGKIPYPLTPQPQPERMACLDAITAYNMYENGNAPQRGYGSQSRFVVDVAARYALFRDALPAGTDFVPSIIPGYNDRGVRPSVDHYAIPRAWAPGQGEGSFLEESFDRLAFPYVDPDLNMILITSFNEWNEDTAIEPLKTAPPTAADQSEYQDLYTQGYSYAGHGTRYLEVVRDKVVAVAGRVCDEAGTGCPGVAVTARQERRHVTVLTDSRGYYRISRGPLLPGHCRVRLRRSGDVRVGSITEAVTWVVDFGG